MLMKRLETGDVTGVIVCGAHNILTDHQARFILRLYRSDNKKGFIKAITQSPYAFTRGSLVLFSKLLLVMTRLIVRLRDAGT